MKLLNRLATNLGGLLASAAVRHWMGSLDFKCAYYDESIDPVKPSYAGQKIYIFWHEYILFPLYLRGNCNLTMLLSQHRDADILTRTAYHMGFQFVRGSSYRGGMTALRELVRRSRDMNLTITPDGPRGPRRVLAQGPVYLASKLGLPIVAMGFGYDSPWRLTTWDHHAIPRPGAAPAPSSAPNSTSPPISTATASNTTANSSKKCSTASRWKPKPGLNPAPANKTKSLSAANPSGAATHASTHHTPHSLRRTTNLPQMNTD